MSKHDDEPRELLMRVVRCDGPVIKVWHVASTEDHIGNNIADGFITREEGFQQLAVYFKTERAMWKHCADKLHAMTVWQHIKQWLHDKWWRV